LIRAINIQSRGVHCCSTICRR